MKKKDLAEKISRKTDFKDNEILQVIDLLTEEIACSLSEGKEVKLFGFGKFVVREYGERNCYNPVTGEMMKLKSSIQPAFIAGPKLREKLNKK